jgi:RNA polymerase sigma factor (sigma-70 family)
MSTDAIELMLADLRWTRRLAVTLARDGAEADDLWSETWSAADREHKKVHRGWIATTMRNVVRMRRRAEKRRLNREAATADFTVEPHTPEELLARVELQRLLAELVTGLGEPYRTTLLLHHVEDLAPVEIARRLAIPAGTVRWRLKVAHDELRDRLIARSGGDRDAWRLALLPLVPSAPLPLLDGHGPRPGRNVPGKGATTMITWKMMALLGSTMAVTGAAVHHGAGATKMLASAAGATANTGAAANGGATAKSANTTTPPSTARPTAATGAGAAAASKSSDDRLANRRAFAVPSAAIADFEAPDLDACFAAAPRSGAYKRVDLTLALKAEGATATIADVGVKHVTDGLAHTPGLADCLRKKLVGHDMPAPAGSGPAELAVLVHDDCPRGTLMVEPTRAGGGPVAADAQAPSLGDPKSRLTITVFSDFQCPFCWRFAARLESLAQLYPGQVRIELRNFPLPIHAQAGLAAEAALAAHEQGKFWPMHDELFANQNTIDREHLRAMAGKIGLDLARFDQALDDGHERARVQGDLELGKRVGVRGVPSTVIGDELVPGALPLEEMVRHVDRALAAKNK